MNYNYTTQRFPSEEGPGASVSYRDASRHIFHTYSSYARGLDQLIGAYNWLDPAPKGRDEDGSLVHTRRGCGTTTNTGRAIGWKQRQSTFSLRKPGLCVVKTEHTRRFRRRWQKDESTRAGPGSDPHASPPPKITLSEGPKVAVKRLGRVCSLTASAIRPERQIV